MKDKEKNGPHLRAAKQVSEVLGMRDIPLIYRRPTAPGLALVGDTAVAPDPVWGQGIGWAIQAAEWLVEATAKALAEEHPEKLDYALERYRQQHQAAFGGRFARDADFAQVRPFNFFERLLYSAAVRDPLLGQYPPLSAIQSDHPRFVGQFDSSGAAFRLDHRTAAAIAGQINKVIKKLRQRHLRPDLKGF